MTVQAAQQARWQAPCREPGIMNGEGDKPKWTRWPHLRASGGEAMTTWWGRSMEAMMLRFGLRGRSPEKAE